MAFNKHAQPKSEPITHADTCQCYNCSLTPQQRAIHEKMAQAVMAENAAHQARIADAKTIAEMVRKHSPEYEFEILENVLYELHVQPSELSDWSDGEDD